MGHRPRGTMAKTISRVIFLHFITHWIWDVAFLGFTKLGASQSGGGIKSIKKHSCPINGKNVDERQFFIS
tara:strand:+ start:212 stop:421 length:210 start_codon:yes stop_codon:yes gene_type:complete